MYLPYIEWRMHFTFHLQYKHCGTFANRKFEELPYPKKSGNVRPHSSNAIRKMLPHHSHSSCEYATPSSGTFPLASYKEVPPPRIGHRQEIWHFGLFHQSIFGFNSSYVYIYWQRRKNSSSTVMKDFVLSSYRSHFFDSHDVKSEFPLSIYIILGILQLIEWIRQLATYLFIFRPLWRKFSCWKLPTILLSLLTAVSSTAN